MTTSLVISTYNRPDALAACLESVRRQRRLPDEVIIADDGSTAPTRELVEALAADFPVPLVHVWHPDEGFRLAAIRNRAMARAKGDYIIQIDGDILLHRDFVADHVRLARRGSYAKGVRVRLDENLSRQICSEGLRRMPGVFTPNISDRVKAMRFLPLARLFAAHFKKGKAYGLGCNMAFFRSDLLRVNGYDEDFVGWGREDDDIAHRLSRAGIGMRDTRFAAVCFHLWHPENSRAQAEANIELCRRRDEEGIIRAVHGIDRYLGDKAD